MAILWAKSADRHEIAHEDAVHAIVNRLYDVQAFGPSRTGGHIPDLFVGPGRDGQMLEVMIESDPPKGGTIFHVMHARAKTIEIARRMAKR